MNQHYELAYIVPISYLEGDLQKVNDEVTAMIKQFGGTITMTEDMGKRRLAYPIKQIHQGSYFAVEFDMESEKAKEFEQKLKLKNEVLRYMIVKKKIKSAEEIAREAKIQEGLRTAKQEELTKIEAEEKASIKKNEDEVLVQSASAKKEANKAKLEDLDKKLDEILKDDVI